MLDPAALPRQAAGLDFVMRSHTTSGSSAFGVRPVAETIGLNLQASGRFMVQGLSGYNDFAGGHPYQYDAPGRNVSFLKGFSWICQAKRQRRRRRPAQAGHRRLRMTPRSARAGADV
jgi:hypothetical protein